MTQARPMVDPAECRRRARVCRERAQRSNINSTELMEAAETWEDLAHHAETLRDAIQQMRAPDAAAKPSS